MELAKAWRTDKMLRRLDASLVVADKKVGRQTPWNLQTRRRLWHRLASQLWRFVNSREGFRRTFGQGITCTLFTEIAVFEIPAFRRGIALDSSPCPSHGKFEGLYVASMLGKVPVLGSSPRCPAVRSAINGLRRCTGAKNGQKCPAAWVTIDRPNLAELNCTYLITQSTFPCGMHPVNVRRTSILAARLGGHVLVDGRYLVD